MNDPFQNALLQALSQNEGRGISHKIKQNRND